MGIALNGAFTLNFISQLYTGSISDRQLFIESGILSPLHLVLARKRAMADRGFDVQDLLVKPNLILNIPPFKGSRTHMTQAEVLETQKIAAVRIHVAGIFLGTSQLAYRRQSWGEARAPLGGGGVRGHAPPENFEKSDAIICIFVYFEGHKIAT